MKTQKQLEKELTEIRRNRKKHAITDFRYYELKALLQQNKEIVEMIDTCIGYSDYKPNMIVIDKKELLQKLKGARK